MNILKNKKTLNLTLMVGYVLLLSSLFIGSYIIEFGKLLGLEIDILVTFGMVILPIFGICSLFLAVYNKRYKLTIPSIVLIFALFIYVSLMFTVS